MKYQTYKPDPQLEALVKFYWTLEVPFDPNHQKQKIVPDGCIEMTFNFGDPIKRYTSETEFEVHPNAMLMGQRTKSFEILPMGHVDTFAICFYPIGFANFIDVSLDTLVDKETALEVLFGRAEAIPLEHNMRQALDNEQRIAIIEAFLLQKLYTKNTISSIVKSTVEALLQTNGSLPITHILKDEAAKRRQLERHFKKQIGISPKQLGKAIRLQATLHLLANKTDERLTDIAYENDYFDQNHFIKDFKDLVGLSPKAFAGHENMALATLFYK